MGAMDCDRFVNIHVSFSFSSCTILGQKGARESARDIYSPENLQNGKVSIY
jgi:hypothetical protein